MCRDARLKEESLAGFFDNHLILFIANDPRAAVADQSDRFGLRRFIRVRNLDEDCRAVSANLFAVDFDLFGNHRRHLLEIRAQVVKLFRAQAINRWLVNREREGFTETFLVHRFVKLAHRFRRRAGLVVLRECCTTHAGDEQKKRGD